MYHALLFAHLLGAVVWIGGMFFMTICLHPALAPLPGPERVRLVVAALGRFLGWVGLSVALIWASGGLMLAAIGSAAMPPGWHVMIGAASVMTLVYAYLRIGPFQAARRAVAAGDIPAAALRLAGIRRLVLVNLALGIVAIAGVTMLR